MYLVMSIGISLLILYLTGCASSNNGNPDIVLVSPQPFPGSGNASNNAMLIVVENVALYKGRSDYIAIGNSRIVGYENNDNIISAQIPAYDPSLKTTSNINMQLQFVAAKYNVNTKVSYDPAITSINVLPAGDYVILTISGSFSNATNDNTVASIISTTNSNATFTISSINVISSNQIQIIGLGLPVTTYSATLTVNNNSTNTVQFTVPVF